MMDKSLQFRHFETEKKKPEARNPTKLLKAAATERKQNQRTLHDAQISPIPTLWNWEKKNWGTKRYKASSFEGYIAHEIVYPPLQKVNEENWDIPCGIPTPRLWSNTVLTSGSKYQGATNPTLSSEITISHKVRSPWEWPVRGELSHPVPIYNLSVQAHARWVGKSQTGIPLTTSLSPSFPSLFLFAGIWQM